ncbi:HDIG domain-containing metalloprotein [Desulfurivibrio sp. C05AmB]|jgi:uncharacterized protein|uniref:HDIG domain-containing metalloprotein n=1 Tax=Desulfurivibrio sp. C05AmB TaxID=3374371 RepID=UPI00376EE274
MPPTEKHFVTSRNRVGQDYVELHRWIDDPVNKNERHDFTRIWEFGPTIRDRFGEEGVSEYIEHLREDMENKFAKLLGEPSAELLQALRYFGIRPNRAPEIKESDLNLLRRAGMAAADIAHSLKVAEKALELAKRTKQPLDLELVARGALFHDLGKARTHAMEHGMIGAEMGRELGLPPEITAIMEKHIRGGLSSQEAAELGLPIKDYTLHRLEERIVIYADRLTDIITEGLVALASEAEAEQRFEEILRDMVKYGKNRPTTERYFNYHREIQGLMAL